ncbi:MAG TPA: hypothetical protein VNX67_00090 [Solirubrobacteraceae bacterium]|nr:hypothetical protein [Solirubrobacteraceae bacterium]
MLIPAIAAAVSLFALAPASALARKHPSPNGRCEIGLNAPSQIAAGEEVLLFGRLHCLNPVREAHQEVRLFHHVWGLPGFTYVQSVTTDAAGFYALSRADGVIETNRAWYVRAQGARSATKRIRVSAQVTLSGPSEGQLSTGFPNRVTFTGTVAPADIGARVILQRQNSLTGNDWHRIDSGIVEPSGTAGVFTILHTFVVPGDANIRVLVRSQGRNVPSESNVLAYSISQAQNPALTIQSSANPIAFGQAVTIAGKVTAGAEQPVTLFARTVRQHGFAPVAQITTNAAGEYSFPAQSPVNSTFYRVQTAAGASCCPPGAACLRSAPMCPLLAPPCNVAASRRPHLKHPGCRFNRVSSAVLYEGVRDVLTAQAAPTTVQAGQIVTFSGTVSPDHTGHVIYLERQNAQAPGFHVIQVSFIGAGSAYAIRHVFYQAATKLVRVYVPGGPENQGAASAPFSILVTPAPASTLMPEAPGNTTLPSEGQS